MLNELGRAVTRSSVLDRQTRHGDTIGTSDLGYNTVSRGASCEGSNEGDLLREVHLENCGNEIDSKIKIQRSWSEREANSTRLK